MRSCSDCRHVGLCCGLELSRCCSRTGMKCRHSSGRQPQALQSSARSSGERDGSGQGKKVQERGGELQVVHGRAKRQCPAADARGAPLSEHDSTRRDADATGTHLLDSVARATQRCTDMALRNDEGAGARWRAER